MNQIRRRQFLLTVGVVLVAPHSAIAQQSKVRRIGLIVATSRQRVTQSGREEKFLEGMRELGYVMGKDFVIEWRTGDGNYDRLPAMAAELVALKVDVILASGSPAIRAAQKATSTVPIVITATGDPVGSGFAASLAHPGGNITGLSLSNDDVSAKYLELLMTLLPTLSRVAVLGNPGSSTHAAILKTLQTTTQRSKVKLVRVDARSPEEIEHGFVTIAAERAEALIVVPEPFLYQQTRLIAALAAQHRVPAIYGSREPVEAGGLMGYGPNPIESWRRAATYVDKILKGAKPAALPIEQPAKFELVINLKTAKSLGLTIPRELLLRADEVIQ